MHGTAGKAYVSRVITHWITLDLNRALDDLYRAGECIRLADDPTCRIRTPTYRVPLTLLWLGRLRRRRAVVDVATELSEELRSLYEFGLVLAARAGLALMCGDVPAAEDDADRALRLQSLSGYRWSTALLYPALAFARLNRGDFDGAEHSRRGRKTPTSFRGAPISR